VATAFRFLSPDNDITVCLNYSCGGFFRGDSSEEVYRGNDGCTVFGDCIGGAASGLAGYDKQSIHTTRFEASPPASSREAAHKASSSLTPASELMVYRIRGEKSDFAA
jgi:hypothetical protein